MAIYRRFDISHAHPPSRLPVPVTATPRLPHSRSPEALPTAFPRQSTTRGACGGPGREQEPYRLRKPAADPRVRKGHPLKQKALLCEREGSLAVGSSAAKVKTISWVVPVAGLRHR